MNALLAQALGHAENNRIEEVHDVIDGLIPKIQPAIEPARLNVIVGKSNHSCTTQNLWRTLKKQSRTASVIDLSGLKSAGT